MSDHYSNQEGRVVIVTGANTGLGYETALSLAEHKAKVIMACRNLLKAETAKSQILEQVPAATIECMEIDLSILESVRQFSRAFQSKFDRLDLLINNAGVMTPPYTQTTDGFELQFGANYLGHFLLTGLLLPLLSKTVNSRVVTLSSLVHRNGKIDFEDLQFEKKYNPSEAYAQSKLACLLFSRELQRRITAGGHSNPISVAAHPGIAITELSRHYPKWLWLLIRYTLAPFLTHSASEGARPTLLAALGDLGDADYFGPTGFKEFKGHPGPAASTDLSKDEALARKLWKVSEELVGFKYL